MHKTTKLLLAILAIVVMVSALVACVPTTYTVTFHLYGEQTNAVEVAQGATVQKPTDPTREGYVFAGWYADENLTVAFDFDSAIEANTDVYAKWTPAGDSDGPGPEAPSLSYNDNGWVELRATAIGLTVADTVTEEIKNVLTATGEAEPRDSFFGDIECSNLIGYFEGLTEKFTDNYFVVRLYEEGRALVYTNGTSENGLITFDDEGSDYCFNGSPFGCAEGAEVRGTVTETGMRITVKNPYRHSDLVEGSEDDTLVTGITQYIDFETVDNSGTYALLGKVFTVGEQEDEVEFGANDYAFRTLDETVDFSYTWHQYGNKAFFNSVVADDESTLMVIDIINSELIVATYFGTEDQIRLTYKSDAPERESIIGKAFTAMGGMVKIQFLTDSKALAEMNGNQTFADYVESGDFVFVTVGEMEITARRAEIEEEIGFNAEIDVEGADMDLVFTLDKETVINLNVPTVAGKEYALAYNGKYTVTNPTAFAEYVAEKAVELGLDPTAEGVADQVVAAKATDIDGLDFTDGKNVFSFYTDGKVTLRHDAATYTQYLDFEDFEQYADKIGIGMFGIGTVGTDGKIIAAIPDWCIGETNVDGFVAYFELTAVDGSTVGIAGATSEVVYGTMWEVESVVANLADDEVLMEDSENYTVAKYKSDMEKLVLVFYKDRFFLAFPGGLGEEPFVNMYEQFGKFVTDYENTSRIWCVLDNGKLIYTEQNYFDNSNKEVILSVTLKRKTVDDPQDPFFNLDQIPPEFITGGEIHPGNPQPEEFLGYEFAYSEILDMNCYIEGEGITEDDVRERLQPMLEAVTVAVVGDDRDTYTYYNYNNGERVIERLEFGGGVEYGDDRSEIVMACNLEFVLTFNVGGNEVHVSANNLRAKFVKSEERAEFELGNAPENAEGTYEADGETMTLYDDPFRFEDTSYIMVFNGSTYNVVFLGDCMRINGSIVYRYNNGKLIPYEGTFNNYEDEYAEFGAIWNKMYTRNNEPAQPVFSLFDGNRYAYDPEAETLWDFDTENGHYSSHDNQEENPASQAVRNFLDELVDFPLVISFSGTTMMFGNADDEIVDCEIVDMQAISGGIAISYNIESENDRLVFADCRISGIIVYISGEKEGMLEMSGSSDEGEIRSFMVYLRLIRP